MPWQRKYDFQSGTKISSSQVDEEFNQLIAAVNQIQTDDNSKDVSLRAIAQLRKITNDTGGPKLSITNPTKNLLTELVALGVDVHTFYAVDGTVNLPNAKSARGIFHQTSTGQGWALAFDYDNKAYFNFLSTGTWLGWRTLVTVEDTQAELWNGGTTGKFMQAGQDAIPTKKLSQCRNGWILVWSDYDNATNLASNYDFTYSYIPKFIATKHNGTGHLFSVPQQPDGTIVKFLNIADDKITGVAGNETGNDGDVVLRYVLEW